MIPIMPRQSSSDGDDDDRPVGLKFTRNNFFNFPKRDNSLKKPKQQAPSPLTSPVMHSARLLSDNRSSDNSSYSQSSQPPVLSPTLPARSPFRIRDSQQAAAAAAAGTAVSTTTVNKIVSSQEINNKSNSSLDDQPTIYSSISSSSSSSVATVEDDLAQELENLWKLKSNEHYHAPKDQKIDINSEDMLLQLLISHAMIDARDYKVLSFEEFETLKQHHVRLKRQVQNAASKLDLDRKIQETSHSLSNLSSNKNRESVILLLDEAVEADKKVKILTQRLNELKSEEVETQYQVLKHTAGVLCLGLQKLENSTQRIVSPSSHSPKPAGEKLSELQAQLDTIKHTLKRTLQKYDIHAQLKPNATANELLNQLESKLSNDRSQHKSLESKLTSLEERSRLNAMAEKKLEIQLRASEEKKQSAETKSLHLQQELDTMISKSAWLPKDDFDFADDNRVQELESDLMSAKESQQQTQQELEVGYVQIAQLKSTVADMELQTGKIQSQVAVFQKREQELKAEVERYRNEAVRLRAEGEKWERTMKRRTVMQVLNNESPSPGEIEAKYEQQMEEQEQEYQAQLKEQAAFLDKTTRQCEKLKEEHDKLEATCRDLELLVREKQKTMDARDIQISQLELQIEQQRSKAASLKINSNDASLQELQALFSNKEAALLDQSAAMEANFEGMMKEFDRLTGTAMEFETDKMNYERRIEELTQEVKILEAHLTEEKTKNLGYEAADTPTTASLRKEFRKMISDMKADHQRTLDREAEEKRRLEKQLKDLKHEREISRYERVNKGVQTLFMA